MHVVLITYGIGLLASLSLFLSFSFPPSLSLSIGKTYGGLFFVFSFITIIHMLRTISTSTYECVTFISRLYSPAASQ